MSYRSCLHLQGATWKHHGTKKTFAKRPYCASGECKQGELVQLATGVTVERPEVAKKAAPEAPRMRVCVACGKAARGGLCHHCRKFMTPPAMVPLPEPLRALV